MNREQWENKRQLRRKQALQMSSAKKKRKSRLILGSAALCILAAVLTVLVLWNLFSGEEAPPAASEPAAALKKVALVTGPEGLENTGYSRVCWESIQSWATDRGIPCSCYQPEEDSAQARVAQAERAIGEGADVLVLPGWYFAQVILELQEAYPQVYFIGMGVSQANLNQALGGEAVLRENAACFSFAEEQAGYLAGYAAVWEGYTGLGFLGSSPVGSVVRYGYGFLQGADAAARELERAVEIRYAYGTGDGAGALADSWYREDSQVIFCCGEGVTLPVISAAGTEGRVIGADVDWSGNGTAVLASAIKDVGNTTQMVLNSIHRGRWSRYAGLADGGCVGLAPRGESWPFRAFTEAACKALKEGIGDGRILVDSSTDALPELSVYTTLHMQE